MRSDGVRWGQMGAEVAKRGELVGERRRDQVKGELKDEAKC